MNLLILPNISKAPCPPILNDTQPWQSSRGGEPVFSAPFSRITGYSEVTRPLSGRAGNLRIADKPPGTP